MCSGGIRRIKCEIDGKTIPIRYYDSKFLKEIGQEGQNSNVYVAHDFQTDAEIVVKKIKKADFRNTDNYFDEAKKLYSSEHPNIASVKYSCQDQDNIYIAMPLFSKGSLSSAMEGRFLKISEIVKYSIDILSGLHHIHSKKLLHCDIKPNNILLTNSNDAILTDFGLAKYLNQDGIAFVDRFYHLHTPPETIESNLISHQSDIFQAGLTIYRMCNGSDFFKNQLDRYSNREGIEEIPFRKAVFSGKFPNRSEYLVHIPQRLRNYIRKALEVNPRERYNSVLDLLNDLSGIEIKYDWQFNGDFSKPEWKCTTDSKEYVINIEKQNISNFLVKTTKKVIKDGKKEQQIRDYCKKLSTFDDAYSLVKKALHDTDL